MNKKQTLRDVVEAYLNESPARKNVGIKAARASWSIGEAALKVGHRQEDYEAFLRMLEVDLDHDMPCTVDGFFVEAWVWFNDGSYSTMRTYTDCFFSYHTDSVIHPHCLQGAQDD